MTEPGAPSARLAELDALRGIAALLVMLFHYTVQAPKVVRGIETVPLSLSFAWGEYGVQLFFAISGFVIIMTLERTHSSRDFAYARFTRLFPAYWAAILCTTLVAQVLGPHALERPFEVVAINFTMLQGFLYVPAVDGAYWSLTVELAFYFCMWALWRLRALNRIEIVLIAWIALRYIWWLLPNASSLGGKLLLVDYIPFFAIGIAAYRVRQGVRRWAQQLPLLLFGLVTTAIVDSAEEAIVYLCTLSVFFALVGEKLRFLDRPVLLWLGALSYPLYLIHQFIGYALIASLEEMGCPAWLATVIAAIAVVSMAHAICQWVEKPSQRLLRRLRNRTRQEPSLV